jgi:hypothetical protein
MSHRAHNEPMKLADIQSVRCRQIGLRELAAYLIMSSLLGSVWSTALRAVSMPAPLPPPFSPAPILRHVVYASLLHFGVETADQYGFDKVSDEVLEHNPW